MNRIPFRHDGFRGLKPTATGGCRYATNGWAAKDFGPSPQIAEFVSRFLGTVEIRVSAG
jgi:hypothetical protein